MFIIAGSRLLNTPPKEFSCGTKTPFWSDNAMPSKVGVVKEIDIYGDASKLLVRPLLVVKCSSNDFVYRYVGEYNETCTMAMCAMS